MLFVYLLLVAFLYYSPAKWSWWSPALLA